MSSYVTKPIVLIMPRFTSFFHAGQCNGSEALSSLTTKPCSVAEASAAVLTVPSTDPSGDDPGAAFSKSTGVDAVLAIGNVLFGTEEIGLEIPEDMLCSAIKGTRRISRANYRCEVRSSDMRRKVAL